MRRETLVKNYEWQLKNTKIKIELVNKTCKINKSLYKKLYSTDDEWSDEEDDVSSCEEEYWNRDRWKRKLKFREERFER